MFFSSKTIDHPLNKNRNTLNYANENKENELENRKTE